MKNTKNDQIRKILMNELRTHKGYLFSGFVTSLLFSGLYWAYLTTAGFTREWTVTTGLSFAASLLFIFTYEGSKKQASKYLGKGSKVFLIPFIAFSIMTGMGTMLLMEQKSVEEKTFSSDSYNTAKKNSELAEKDLRTYGWASALDISAEEKKKERLLQSTAKRPNGKSSGKNVSYVLAKAWPSYAHYQKKVDDIDARITAANKYQSAKASYERHSSTMSNSTTGGGDNAQWLTTGVANAFFEDNKNKIMYAAFAIYLFASLILELSGYFNGQKVNQLTKTIYGIDPGNLDGLVLEPAENTARPPAANESPRSKSAARPQQAEVQEDISRWKNKNGSINWQLVQDDLDNGDYVPSLTSGDEKPQGLIERNADELNNALTTSDQYVNDNGDLIIRNGATYAKYSNEMLEDAYQEQVKANYSTFYGILQHPQFEEIAFDVASGSQSPVINQIRKKYGIGADTVKAIYTMLEHFGCLSPASSTGRRQLKHFMNAEEFEIQLTAAKMEANEKEAA